MSSWGNNDNAANAPYWAVNSTIMNVAGVKSGKNTAPTAANVALLYGNTTPNVYMTNQEIGLFMVNGAETSAGGDNVTGISLSFAGTRYTGGDTITFSGGGGTGAAATSSGTVGGPISYLSMTNAGSGYTSAPTVVIALPRRTITTTYVDTTTNLFSFDDHSLVAGDAIKYFHGGGAAAGGLTNNTTYYVIASGLISGTGGKFKVSATSGGSEVDITSTGNNAQYFELTSETDRATAIATLGSGAGGTQVTQPGWVLRTVGAGGRAGRVQYETLVALANPIGDGSDDLVLPDA